MSIEYNYLAGPKLPFEVLKKCSKLYSNHYGRYSANSPHFAGRNIKLSESKITDLFINETTNLYLALDGDDLVGYALLFRIDIKEFGFISWVTQLVVHEKYRNIGVAKKMLWSAWGMTDDKAWGIMSANPYAIRALEATTRRRCQPTMISSNKKILLKIGKKYIPFLKLVENPRSKINNESSRIYTNFFVDQSEKIKMIDDVTSNGVPWLLGDIKEGWEWFAFTFQEQDQNNMTEQEAKDLISASETNVKRAYARMLLDGNHKWAKQTVSEVDFIIKSCGLIKGDSILDLGCGIGRHSIELAKRGFAVTGLDNNEELIDKAREKAKGLNLTNILFKVADCRNINLGNQYDAVLCLYDVIGTFIGDGENEKILMCIDQHLKPSCFALLSVMNYEHTMHNAKNHFTLQNLGSTLQELKSSQVMEKTGNIHDPNYYYLDKEAKIVIRKEQFRSGDELPQELIVPDRRYEKKEIEAMCRTAGLQVEWANYMSVGKWTVSEELEGVNAKEILVLCKKI